MRLGDRPAADAGAGRDRIDPPRREEHAPRPIQIRVVAVDVAHVDPRAHHVAKLHPSLLQQVFGKTEHAERLFVGIFARPAQAGGMEPGLVAEVDPQAVRTGALGTAAGGPGLDRFEPRRRLVRKDGLHQDLEAGALVQRWLLDLGRGGPVRRHAMRGENPVARLADGLDARPQVAQEDRLGDD